MIPIGRDVHAQALVRITRINKNEYQIKYLADVCFVPLIGEQGWELSIPAPKTVVEIMPVSANGIGIHRRMLPVALDRGGSLLTVFSRQFMPDNVSFAKTCGFSGNVLIWIKPALSVKYDAPCQAHQVHQMHRSSV